MPDSSGNKHTTTQSGAKSGALGAQSREIDPDLAAVIEAWEKLPDAVKAGIAAMVNSTR